MNILTLLYLVIVALVLTFIFGYLFKIRGPWNSFWTFFLILFLGMWAASLYLTPFGPYWQEVNLVPPLAVGVLIAILLAAAAPSPKARAVLEERKDAANQEHPYPVIAGVFFWIFIAVLIAVIIAAIY